MQKKSILIIGGGEIGLNQIKIAKKIGFNVIVTDVNPSAPGLKAADVGVNISATDINSLLAFALENKDRYNISAVYCGNDFGLLAVECIKQVLNLSHNSIESTVRCINKKLMKDCWHRDSIVTPDGYSVSSSDEAMEAINKTGFPAIVKPADSSGSRGISLVENKEKLQGAVQEAFKHTKSESILIEQFIKGTHHDFNAFFYRGKFYACGIMDRYFTPFPYCVPIKGYYPSILSAAAKKDIYNLVEKAGRSIGLREGAVKADIVVRDGHPYIYEISNRFHGDVSTSHIFDFVGQKSSLEAYFYALYNDKVLPDSFDSVKGKVCGWYVLMLSPGKTGGFKINFTKGLKKILMRNRENDSIGKMRDNTEVPGFVWIIGQTRDEINKRYNEILSDLERQRRNGR